jgi:hypothetical protein
VASLTPIRAYLIQMEKSLSPMNNLYQEQLKRATYEGTVMEFSVNKKQSKFGLLVDLIPVFNADKSLQFVICSFNNITESNKC